MFELEWVSSGALLLAAMALIAWGVYRRRCRGCRAHCPGPRPGLIKRWLPHRLIVRGVCGYPLDHAIRVNGLVRCPECGRESTRNELRPTPHAFRPLVAGLLVAALSIVLPVAVDWRWSEALRFVPAPPLISLELVLEERTPLPVQNELRRRVKDASLSASDAARMARVLLRELRDDDIRFNGMDAIGQFGRLGADAAPALESALESTDWQQRQLAAHILRDNLLWPPSNALIRVSIEGTRRDDLPRRLSGSPGRSARSWVYNARSSLRYLAQHALVAREQLIAGISSDDPQQRLLCAAALGLGGCESALPVAVPLLLEHLRDNSIQGDGVLAARALYGFGVAALPALEAHQTGADSQQDQAVAMLIERITADRDGREPRYRHGSPLTSRIFDPADICIEDISGRWME